MSLLIRCSSIFKIMGEPKNKAEKESTGLTQVAKSYLIELAKEQQFGFTSFDGAKYTEKGNLLENAAIEASGLIRAKNYTKNSERLQNNWITGECDIYDRKKRLIIDEKCSWDIGTHPFFKCEAEAKVKSLGYDWQMQGYMWLYDCDHADIDFWLFPCPEELLGHYDEPEKLIDAVERIPLRKRITTISIKRDDAKIEQIKEKAEACQCYYDTLINELQVA